VKNKPYPLNTIIEFEDLRTLLCLTESKYGDSTAFTFTKKAESVSISYRQFKADVDSLGCLFLNTGIKGKKIALLGENSYEWILAYFAAVNSGNIVVPIDKELPSAEIKNLICSSEPEAIIFSSAYSEAVDYLKEQGVAVQKYINTKDLSDMLQEGEKLIASGDTKMADTQINTNDLAVLMYTSGTTGTPKGAMLSHKNIASNAMAASKNCYGPGVSLLVLPLHHSFTFTVGVVCAILYGCKIVINQSLKNVASDFVKYKPNNAVLVPLLVEAFYKKVWSTANSTGKTGLLKALIRISNTLLLVGIDLRAQLFKSVVSSFGGKVDVFFTGGAPIDPSYIRGLGDLGIKVLNGYGITECSPVVAVNRNYHHKEGSVGTVLSGVEVKILNPDEKGLGEICVKGDIVMLGYFKNDQATDAAFDQGWFKTGDVGYLDKEGFLFIAGREKNMIILNNGKNIYPEELEADLQCRIPYIKETVVFAENNMLVAEVFLDADNYPNCSLLLESDILRFNRYQAPYKNIGKTIIRETEFPKTTTRKIKRQTGGYRHD
jgi:long-chain acyl-CoA synthetase